MQQALMDTADGKTQTIRVKPWTFRRLLKLKIIYYTNKLAMPSFDTIINTLADKAEAYDKIKQEKTKRGG